MDRRVDYLPLTGIHPASRNPKKHALTELGASFDQFGYVEPMVLDDRTEKLVAGHGRREQLIALSQSGAQPPAGINLSSNGEWLVPVLRGWSSKNDEEAEAFLLTSNKLTELGGWNRDDLAPILADIQNRSEIDLTSIGWAQKEIDEIIAASEIHNSEEEDEEEQARTKEEDRFLLFSKDEVQQSSFEWFREQGFQYPEIRARHVMLQQLNRLASLSSESAQRSTAGSKIADTYHRHRLHASAAGMKAPFDAFMDDKLLKKAIDFQLTYGADVPAGYFPALNFVSGTQACSNFRPAFAMDLYRRHGKRGGIILDPCTGYGGRLVGWIASGLRGTYVGVDPNRPTYEANKRLATDLAQGEAKLICDPFEDADLTEYAEAIDFAFTSPPYFAKELYAEDDRQSWVRYKTLDEWVGGFLRPLFDKCYAALKPDLYCIINIADVKMKNRTYPLEQETRDTGIAAGFKLVEMGAYPLGNMPGVDHKDGASEPVFIFRKE